MCREKFLKYIETGQKRYNKKTEKPATDGTTKPYLSQSPMNLVTPWLDKMKIHRTGQQVQEAVNDILVFYEHGHKSVVKDYESSEDDDGDGKV